MYYISNGKVFEKEGEVYRNVGFSAKNKVIVTQELESVTKIKGTVKAKSLENPILVTETELFAKLGLSEDKPIELIEADEIAQPKKTKKK